MRRQCSEVSNRILFFTPDIFKPCTQQENVKLTHIIWKLFPGMICTSLILLPYHVLLHNMVKPQFHLNWSKLFMYCKLHLFRFSGLLFLWTHYNFCHPFSRAQTLHLLKKSGSITSKLQRLQLLLLLPFDFSRFPVSNAWRNQFSLK